MTGTLQGIHRAAVVEAPAGADQVSQEIVIIATLRTAIDQCYDEQNEEISTAQAYEILRRLRQQVVKDRLREREWRKRDDVPLSVRLYETAAIRAGRREKTLAPVKDSFAQVLSREWLTHVDQWATVWVHKNNYARSVLSRPDVEEGSWMHGQARKYLPEAYGLKAAPEPAQAMDAA